MTRPNAWQPIETAPKDGTRVLCYSPVDGVVASHFEGDVWQGFPWRNGAERIAALPTHWQPLPPPPSGAAPGEGGGLSSLRGFGFTFDLSAGRTRNWYIDGEGAKRWADNDELVSGLNGQHDATPPHSAEDGHA